MAAVIELAFRLLSIAKVRSAAGVFTIVSVRSGVIYRPIPHFRSCTTFPRPN